LKRQAPTSRARVASTSASLAASGSATLPSFHKNESSPSGRWMLSLVHFQMALKRCSSPIAAASSMP
jgi:hypothetical protein